MAVVREKESRTLASATKHQYARKPASPRFRVFFRNFLFRVALATVAVKLFRLVAAHRATASLLVGPAPGVIACAKVAKQTGIGIARARSQLQSARLNSIHLRRSLNE